MTYNLSFLQKCLLTLVWPIVLVILAAVFVFVLVAACIVWPFLPFIPVSLKLKYT